jgi:E3 ubiquitin-protein ligase makorin
MAVGYCKRGEKCWFRHVTPPNPTANTADPLICPICMEEPVTFGLLGLDLVFRSFRIKADWRYSS